MKKILITGGAGFIGSHVADIFLENNYEVVVIDNLSSGQKKNISQRAIFYEADICDAKKIEEIFYREKPEIVSHHAAQINVRVSLEQPEEDARVNIMGGLNILNACIKNDVQHFLFASTGGAIYGETQNIPTPETEKEVPPSPYGIAKLSFEKYLEFYRKIHGLSYTILRYANVYGPRQNAKGEAGVVSIFITKLLRNETCIINGDGVQTRDFVFVKDVAKANFLAAERRIQEVFNIGTAQETDVNTLYSTIAKSLGDKSSAQNTPSVAGEIQRSCLDFSRIAKILGWKPSFSLENGIAETVQYFQENS